MSSLVLLSNCSEQALEYHEFDNATKTIKILTPYLKSTDSCIRMTAQGIAVHLGVFLSGDELKELALTPMEINELVKALGLALGSPDLSVNVFGVRISAREILSLLDLSTVVDSNLALLLKSDVLNFILSTLIMDDKDTVEAAISFVWTIAITTHRVNGSPSDLQEQLSLACPILKQLSTSKTSFSNLAECAFLSLQPDLHMSKLGDTICYYDDMINRCLVNMICEKCSNKPKTGVKNATQGCQTILFSN